MNNPSVPARRAGQAVRGHAHGRAPEAERVRRDGKHLAEPAQQGALAGYHHLPSVRGELLARLGRDGEAAAEFRRAAALGLVPAARAEEILAAQRPVLESAGFRVGREIGELSVSRGTHGFQEARAAALDSPRQIPLAGACGERTRHHLRAVLRVRRDTMDPRRRVPGRARRWRGRRWRGRRWRGRARRGRFARWLARRPVAGVLRRIRRARPGQDPVARGGAYGYRRAALADPGGVLPGPARLGARRHPRPLMTEESSRYLLGTRWRAERSRLRAP